jgi:16S rRNA (adenine1518-N6/adenine1519-N6)-dimethyltransferase
MPSTLLPPLNAAAVLRQFGLRADKSLGQNFLQDPIALERIVTAAEITAQDTVLEIGPGLGSLTRYLAATARHVTAVELDARLLPALGQVLAPFNNVRIVQGDILKVPPAMLVSESGYLVVANIPYYITSAVMRHLLSFALRPRRMVLTIQREVAERICAEPGGLSLLALSVQIYGRPRIAAHIPAGAFYPVPNVDSAALRVDLFEQPIIDDDSIEPFFRLAKAGFSQKRKTLRNAMAAGLRMQASQVEALLLAAGIDPQRRAETVSLVEWHTLTEIYKKQQQG